MLVGKLFKRSRLMRKIIVHFYDRKENGVWRSSSVRKLYKEIKQVDAGYGSYGWTSDLIEGPATIGKYTSIGKNVRRISVNHKVDYATTHPCVFNPAFGWVSEDDRKRNHIQIGNDVWIGDNVMILPSCRIIGDGAVVAAGAIVTKDIPPYEIWGGVPASCIKHRFSEDIVEGLQKSQWWNLPEENLKTLKDYFADPKMLIDKLNEISNK